MYGYAKNEQENLDDREVRVYKKLAKQLFALSNDELERYVANQILTEVMCCE